MDIQDIINNKLYIVCHSSMELNEFLMNCEFAGVVWINGTPPTSWLPSGAITKVYYTINSKKQLGFDWISNLELDNTHKLISFQLYKHIAPRIKSIGNNSSPNQIKLIKFDLELPMEFPDNWTDSEIEYFLNDNSYYLSSLLELLQRYIDNHNCVSNVVRCEVIPQTQIGV